MRPLTAPARTPAPRPAAPRAQGRGPRRDPAPSRWSYRLNRLWLTPGVRLFFRLGVPLMLLAGGVGLWLGDANRRAALVDRVVEMREAFEQRPEFIVSMLAVEGASPALDEAVRAKLALALPQSSFDLDLVAARDRVVQGLDAVADADLRVRPGGVLQVTVTERVPALVWRKGEVMELLDATGHRVALILDRAARPDLPLVAGEGADAAAPEALALVAAAGPLLPRLRGLVRISERRWDLVLDRNQTIQLPAEAPVRALERLIVLDQAQDLLARDVAVVDLRLQARPVLRLTADALRAFRDARGLQTVENAL